MKLAYDICKVCGGVNLDCICYKPVDTSHIYAVVELEPLVFHQIVERLEKIIPKYRDGRYISVETEEGKQGANLVLNFGGEIALTMRTKQ